MSKPQTMTWAPLFKRTSGGGTQLWQIEVVPQPDDTAVIVTTFGLVDGKQQRQEERITEGKNGGKRNATTPLQQACAEAEAEWKKKQERKGYGLDAGGDESAAKRAASPMLAYSYEDYGQRVQWDSAFGQPKLDGFRCLARRDGKEISLVSREGKPISTLPHIVATLLDVLPDGGSLDGELWTPDLNFQQIASAVKRQQEISEQVQYHVYDAPLLDRAFEARQLAIESAIGDGAGPVRRVQTLPLRDHEELLAFQSDCVEEGYEGAMLRYGTDGYAAGKRARTLLKVKTFTDAEFEIIGAVEGRGTHAGMAIFQCQTDAGVPFDVLAPGTHADKKAAWNDRTRLIGRKLTVKYFELTSSEQPVPRFPVAVRIHEKA